MKITRKGKFFLVFLLLIVLLPIGLQLGVDYWLNQKLPELLNKNPERKYNLTYESFEVDLFAGTSFLTMF